MSLPPRIVLASRSPRRAERPPFPGRLANDLSARAPTLGLSGSVQVSPPGEIPRFILALDTDHPLARQQREGIFLEQAIEWASRTMHP